MDPEYRDKLIKVIKEQNEMQLRRLGFYDDLGIPNRPIVQKKRTNNGKN